MSRVDSEMEFNRLRFLETRTNPVDFIFVKTASVSHFRSSAAARIAEDATRLPKTIGSEQNRNGSTFVFSLSERDSVVATRRFDPNGIPLSDPNRKPKGERESHT